MNYQDCKRVFTLTKKPSRQEFKSIVKVTGLGIGMIGLLGFAITVLKMMVFK